MIKSLDQLQAMYDVDWRLSDRWTLTRGLYTINIKLGFTQSTLKLTGQVNILILQVSGESQVSNWISDALSTTLGYLRMTEF